jgi:ABC-type nitrate/sulfonate/bicarbonate transport system substrate-binding protein
MSRRFTWPFAIVCAAGAVLASACSPGSTDAGGPAAAGPPVRIAVGIDASYAPFFLADSEGLFADRGVNVEIVQFGTGGEGVSAVATGEIQLAGASDVTIISQLGRNPDLRTVVPYEESGDYLKVVARPDAADPAAIRKVGIVPGLSQLAAIRFLESRGIDPASVEFVTAGPPEIPALMQQGDIDAYVLWEPWPTRGTELGGTVLGTTGDYGLSYLQWLVGDAAWVEQNRDTVAKVVAALAQAAERTESDPQLAAEATSDAAKIDPSQTVRAIEEIDFGVRDLGPGDVTAAEKVAEFLVGEGVLPEVPDLSAVLLQGWYSANAPKEAG